MSDYFFYRPPLGLPLYWRDEVSGQLPAAVDAYLDNRIEGEPILEWQITLLRDYIVHFINAPCWTNNLDPEDEDGARTLSELRAEAPKLTTPEMIAAWSHKAMSFGLDPL